ncbi:hypothetical protein [Magnetospirillum sp. LM-5]|uniref:hypothetical protein n=1 Tax=Magnetospirillum sp. LM-5 TaxID=2681466 RepID=UPI00156EB707|nr:hypothetical protein [Magnetospirillum sp. LM-5]
MTARALVFFGDGTGLWWLKLLRPGFRHCFVAVEGAGGWVVVDPLSDRTRVAIVPAASADELRRWYARHNYQAVFAEVHEPNERAMPWRPYSCVEEVKRVLGINAGHILTPWQLYKYMSRNRKNTLAFNPPLAYIQKRGARKDRVSPVTRSADAEFLRRQKEQNKIIQHRRFPWVVF